MAAPRSGTKRGRKRGPSDAKRKGKTKEIWYYSQLANVRLWTEFVGFRSGLWKAGCDVVRLLVLQRYRSCTFCKRKARGETQFWIELAAPCTLANHNEINSDNTLPFIVFLTPVSCDGSNRLWRQRLLLSPCSLWRHNQTLFGVIRPLTGGKCRTFCRVIEQFCFHRYLCFHYIFCVRVFCILFLRTEWQYRT